LHAAERDRPDVAAARAKPKIQQRRLATRCRVFIDETAGRMVRHHGRSRCGQRLVAKVPHGHWKTLTFIDALPIVGGRSTRS
jgi:hypothetical protein